MGKNVGDDLAEGKPTLPLIHALAHAGEDDAACIRNAITAHDGSQLERVIGIVRGCGSLEYTRAAARREHDAALVALGSVPESQYRQTSPISPFVRSIGRGDGKPAGT
jgi:octaprenyl-diphosphate synthase